MCKKCKSASIKKCHIRFVRLCPRRVLQNHLMCGLNLMVMLYLIAFNRFFLPLFLYFGLIAFKKIVTKYHDSLNQVATKFCWHITQYWGKDGQMIKRSASKGFVQFVFSLSTNPHLKIQITLLTFLEKHNPPICSDLTTDNKK